jgi:hypothetical protein
MNTDQPILLQPIQFQATSEHLQSFDNTIFQQAQSDNIDAESKMINVSYKESVSHKDI